MKIIICVIVYMVWMISMFLELWVLFVVIYLCWKFRSLILVFGRFLILVLMVYVFLKGNIYLVGKNLKERIGVYVNKFKSYEFMIERIECLCYLLVKWL